MIAHNDSLHDKTHSPQTMMINRIKHIVRINTHDRTSHFMITQSRVTMTLSHVRQILESKCINVTLHLHQITFTQLEIWEYT